MSALTTTDLSIGYPNFTVAENLNLHLNTGELVCLIGPNGVGKSTLMRTLAAMQSPLAGSVRIQGDEVQALSADELARRLSIVLTQRPDVGLLSGYDVVALGRHPYTGWAGQLTAHDKAVVQWAVRAVKAEDVAQQPFDEMSDGQRQKIMIARALAQEPAVMLLDEPTAFLDLPRRVEIMQLLRQLARHTQRAILLSTHDLDLALRTADCIWLMSSKMGIQVGAPEDLVLSGAFESVFRSEGVTFDSHTGTFKMNTPWHQAITLQGTDPLLLIWTQRALEREGFLVAEQGETALAAIFITTDTWILQTNDHQTSFNSIYTLITHLSTFAVTKR